MKSSTVVLALALLGTSASAADPRDVAMEQGMFADALILERDGKGPEAVEAYSRAARSGSGKAALRLAEIYEQGIPGVARDYPGSLKWRNAARILGENVAPLSEEQRRKQEAERRAVEERRRAAELPQREALVDEGQRLEHFGKGSEAVQVYARAARDGSGRAAKRLGEIYSTGIPGVAPDYAVSLKWYNVARILGEDMPPKR